MLTFQIVDLIVYKSLFPKYPRSLDIQDLGAKFNNKFSVETIVAFKNKTGKLKVFTRYNIPFPKKTVICAESLC